MIPSHRVGRHGRIFHSVTTVPTFPVRSSECEPWGILKHRRGLLLRSSLSCTSISYPATPSAVYRARRLIMSESVQANAVRPVDGSARPSTGLDIEKSFNPAVHHNDSHSDTDTKSVESDNFQNGVQRVRAITEIWSKPTLISMFILYVHCDTTTKPTANMYTSAFT